MPKRDNAYLLDRLQREHPAVYADLSAGRIKSVRQAAIGAGLIKPRSRLSELKNAWSKASAAERDDFGKWASLTITASGSPRRQLTRGRRLEPWAIARIDEIMKKRRLAMGDVMAELGAATRDGSLGNAMSCGHKLRPVLIEALERWLDDHQSI